MLREVDSHTARRQRFLNYFETSLKTLFKTFSILFDESSDTFHSICVCFIRLRIFNLASPELMYVCIWLPPQMSLRAFVLIYMSPDSSSVDDSLIESEIYSYSSSLRSFSTKLPSSKCEKVIIFPVFL